jgi:Phage integrase, N-terminal SAM-like domain
VFARKADAQRFLTEMENSKLKGTWTDPALGRVLFRDWLGEWWATTTNLRPTTRERNETLLRRYALPRFGDMALVAISQRDVRAWVAELSGRGLAPTSSSARSWAPPWMPGCSCSRRAAVCRCPGSSGRRCGS